MVLKEFAARLVIPGRLTLAPLRAKDIVLLDAGHLGDIHLRGRAIDNQIDKLRCGQRRDFYAPAVLRLQERITGSGIVRKGRKRGEIDDAVRIVRQHLHRPIGNTRQRRQAQGRRPKRRAIAPH